MLTNNAQLCDHLGLLVFANALTTIPQATSPPEPLLAQWLGGVLLGARNIEQTKYLNWQDLGPLLAADSGQRDQTQRQQRLTELQTTLAQCASQHLGQAAGAPTTEEKKELTRLQNASQRHQR